MGNFKIDIVIVVIFFFKTTRNWNFQIDKKKLLNRWKNAPKMKKKKKNQGLHPLPTPPGLKAISYIKIVIKRWTNWKNARNSQKILGAPFIKSIITYKTSFRKRDSFQYRTCTFWPPSIFIDCHCLYYSQFGSIFRFIHESVPIF